MANSDRKIIRGVQVGATTYAAGKEDELSSVISASEVKRLQAKGYLEGSWSSTKVADPEPIEPDKPKADKPKKEK